MSDDFEDFGGRRRKTSTASWMIFDDVEGEGRRGVRAGRRGRRQRRDDGLTLAGAASPAQAAHACRHGRRKSSPVRKGRRGPRWPLRREHERVPRPHGASTTTTTCRGSFFDEAGHPPAPDRQLDIHGAGRTATRPRGLLAALAPVVGRGARPTSCSSNGDTNSTLAGRASPRAAGAPRAARPHVEGGACGRSTGRCRRSSNPRAHRPRGERPSCCARTATAVENLSSASSVAGRIEPRRRRRWGRRHAALSTPLAEERSTIPGRPSS